MRNQTYDEIEKYINEAEKFELFTDHKRERNIHLYKGLGYHKGKNEVVAEDFGCNSNSLGKIFLDKKSNLFNSITAS